MIKLIYCLYFDAIRATRHGYELLYPFDYPDEKHDDNDAPYEYYTTGDTLYCSLRNVSYCYIGVEGNVLYCFRSNIYNLITYKDKDNNGNEVIIDTSHIPQILAYNKYIPFTMYEKIDAEDSDDCFDNDVKPWYDDHTFDHVECTPIPLYNDTSINQEPDWDAELTEGHLYWLLKLRYGEPEYSFDYRSLNPADRRYFHKLSWTKN